MSGEKDLRTLLGAMEPHLDDRHFVFAATDNKGEAVGFEYLMRFREAEGTTFVLEQKLAEAAGLTFEFPCRLITLRVHSSLEAVGLMAAITSRLAALTVCPHQSVLL
ncbi:MAG: ACT domain-containing protein [Pseudomonadota bacterium]